MIEKENVYVGRQPIVDGNQTVYGYEILFRNSQYKNVAEFDDSFTAIATTLVNLFEKFGIESIIGKNIGFINVSDRFILSDFVDIIPKENFVMEILETVNVTDELVKRIKSLKDKGFKFALDDFIFEEEYINKFRPLLEFASYIKIEIPSLYSEIMWEKIKILNSLPAKIVAEKIETFDIFNKCLKSGFQLFQGYFFARPTILEASKLDPSRVSVLKIINLINKDKSINEIVQVLETNPILTFNFLKFVNSAAFFFRTNIKSIRHAISLIGLRKLQSWLMLSVYASKRKNSINSPLFQTAVVRAKTMETILSKLYKTDKEMSETGFLIGLFSLIDSLFGRPKEELIKQLNLDTDAEKAILNYEGEMGAILKAIELDEQEYYAEAENTIISIGITYSDLHTAKLTSFGWANKIIASLNSA